MVPYQKDLSCTIQHHAYLVKFPLGVNVNGCLSLCMLALWWGGDLSRAYPVSSLVAGGIGSSPVLAEISGSMLN